MGTCVFSRKCQQGFTLTELLVALLVGSITLTALITFFSFQTAAMRSENAQRAAQMTARGALNFITRNLEHIGRANSTLASTRFTAAAPAIQSAAADSINYLTHLSKDNENTTDPWENVTFSYDAGAIWVSQGGGAPIALTDAGDNPKSRVPNGGLVFTYFDANGNVVAPGGNAAARASIRRINVLIEVRGIVPTGHPVPKVRLSQDVFLRNTPDN